MIAKLLFFSLTLCLCTCEEITETRKTRNTAIQILRYFVNFIFRPLKDVKALEKKNEEQPVPNRIEPQEEIPVKKKEVPVSTQDGRKKLEKYEKEQQTIRNALNLFFGEAFYGKKCNLQQLRGRKLGDYNRFDPYIFNRSATEMIISHGYKVESHTAQTRDGYFLGLHRIMRACCVNCTADENKVVILQHGLMGSSDDWLLLGAKDALPYLLSDAGYDVWLANCRGNKYSKLHTDFPDDSEEFWDFSFHEIGIYDLRANIDYVKNKSQATSVEFIGYSMGAAAFLILMSSLPRYNRVVKSATLLAPLVFMHQINGPLKLLADFHREYAGNSLAFLGVNEFLPNEQFPREVVAKYCHGDSKLCDSSYLLIANGGKPIKNQYVRGNVLGHLPTGASMKTIMHYIQLINSGAFQKFDYGSNANFKRYGSTSPPLYKLGKVTVPVTLFSSADDWLCTKQSVIELSLHVQNLYLSYQIKKNNFSHVDYLWSNDATSEVYKRILFLYEQNHVTNENTTN